MRFCPECGLETADDVDACPDDGTATMRTTESPARRLGHLIDGRYRLLRCIGLGGMGTVYEATQEPVGRRVAVKVMRDELARNPAAVKRFLHEARVVSRLRHPNTVTLYEFGKSPDGTLYIAMELMTGERLDERMTRDPPTLEEVVDWCGQICDSLREAHALGIIHRDLKPENIFVDSVGDQSLVKVLDFGIAKVQGTSSVTRSGTVFGTPGYMSPEQAQGHDLDARSDLYALGILIYELLSGRLPYDATSAMTVALAHILEPLPDVRGRARYHPLPDSLVLLVTRLLAKSPAGRPKSAERVHDALLEIERQLQGKATVAARADASERPSWATRSQLMAAARPSAARSDDSVALSRRGRRWLFLGIALLGAFAAALLWQGDGPGGPVEIPAPASPQPADDRAPAARGPSAPSGDGSAAPARGVEPRPAANASYDDDLVPIRLELRPDDAEVYLGDSSTAVCEGSACAALELPRSAEPVTLRVTRRRYEEARVAVVPDRPRALTVRLEREDRPEASLADESEAEIPQPVSPSEPAQIEIEDEVNAAQSELLEDNPPEEPAAGSPLMQPVTLPR